MIDFKWRLIERLEVDRSAVEKLGDAAAELLVDRVRRGRDADGRPFRGYADGRAGRVDLYDTGRLLRSVKLRAKRRGRLLRLVIGPSPDQRRKALALEERGFDWLGLSQKDVDELARRAARRPPLRARRVR